MAVRYEKAGMHVQARDLYEYIYAHPSYVLRDTWGNYGSLLIKMGERDEGRRILSQGVEALNAQRPSEVETSRHQRAMGAIYASLEHTERARAAFERALALDQRQIRATSDPNEKAKLLWSTAKTYAESGDVAAAIRAVREASATATSERLRFHLEWWTAEIRRTTSGEEVSVRP
jgi:tetratricopeptide (TPR) repeat protein